MRLGIRHITAIAILLFVIRMVWTQEIRFVFLNWNLFLAWLPLYFAMRSKTSRQNFVGLAHALAWFVLLPNSFYIFTDLVHLRWSSDFWKLYDSLLILVYALAGARYGFQSIYVMQERLMKIYRRLKLDPQGAVITLLLVCSFGVYIGRMGRWNSWDLVYRPLDVAQYVLEITRLSGSNVDVFTFTGLFWLLLVLFFIGYHHLTDKIRAT